MNRDKCGDCLVGFGVGGQWRRNKWWWTETWLGWWTHNTVYTWCVVEMCTWHPYNFVNQCRPLPKQRIFSHKMPIVPSSKERNTFSPVVLPPCGNFGNLQGALWLTPAIYRIPHVGEIFYNPRQLTNFSLALRAAEKFVYHSLSLEPESLLHINKVFIFVWSYIILSLSGMQLLCKLKEVDTSHCKKFYRGLFINLESYVTWQKYHQRSDQHTKVCFRLLYKMLLGRGASTLHVPSNSAGSPFPGVISSLNSSRTHWSHILFDYTLSSLLSWLYCC